MQGVRRPVSSKWSSTREADGADNLAPASSVQPLVFQVTETCQLRTDTAMQCLVSQVRYVASGASYTLFVPHSFPGLQPRAPWRHCTYQKCRVKLSRNGDRLFLAGGPSARNILPEEIWSIFMESRIRLSMGLMFISHLRPF